MSEARRERERERKRRERERRRTAASVKALRDAVREVARALRGR